MKKRLLSILCALAMLLTLLPTSALAAEEKIVTVTTSELVDLGTIQTTAAPRISLFSAETGSVDPVSTNEVKWIDRVDLPNEFDQFYAALEEASDGDDINDWLIDPTADGTVNVSSTDEKTQTTITYQAVKLLEVPIEGALMDKTTIQYYLSCIRAAYDAFDRDHPEVFWLNGNSKSFYTQSYSYEGNNPENITQSTTTFYFVLTATDSDETVTFDVRDTDTYTTVEIIKTAITDRDNSIAAIKNSGSVTVEGESLSYIDTASDYDKVRFFNAWLTHNNQYNTSDPLDSAPDSAWACVSALAGSTGADGPVCEGYARAFKVLCDSEGIPCVLVDGTATNSSGSEAHMWDYVQLESDGPWYAVDVTWNDPTVSGEASSDGASGYENEDYFLVGSNTVDGNSTFGTTHPVANQPSEGGLQFTNGPQLNDQAYTSSASLTSVSISAGTDDINLSGVPVPGKGTTTTIQLKATASYDNSTTSDVTASASWELGDSYGGVKVSTDGQVTIQPSAEAGTFTVQATFGGQTDSVTITLTKDDTDVVAELGTISGNDSVALPAASSSSVTATYSVTAYNKYGETISSPSIVWSIEGDPTGITINDGTLTVTNEAAAGTITLKATSGALTATKTISITKSASVVTDVDISPGSVASIAVPEVAAIGGTGSNTMQLSAIVTDQYGDRMSSTVSWTISGDTTGVEISDAGLLSVDNTAVGGTVTVTATCGNNVTDSLTVTITKATSQVKFLQITDSEGDPVFNDSVTIPTEGTPVIRSYSFKAYDQYGSEMTGQTVSWSATSATGVTWDASTCRLSVASGAQAGNITLTVSYNTISDSITVQLTNKEQAGVNIQDVPVDGSMTYGTDLTLGATAVNTGTGTPTWFWSSSDDTTLRVDGTGDSARITALKVGSATITVTYSDDTSSGSDQVTITVTPADMTYAQITLDGEDRVYNGTAQTVGIQSVTLRGKPLVSGTDYKITNGSTGTNAGSYALTISGTGNYTGTATASWSIAKATPKVTFPNPTAAYGQTLSEITLTNPSGNIEGTWRWIYPNLEVDNAPGTGTQSFAAEFTPADTNNYESVTGPVNINIIQAAAPTLPDQNISHKAGATGTQMFSVAGLMPSGAGALTYATGTKTDEKGIISGWSVSSAGMVSYTLSGTGEAGDTASMDVVIGSTNYEDATITLIVTLVEKDAPILNVQPIVWTYSGQAVPVSAIRGTATLNGTEISGSWAWSAGNIRNPINVADSGAYLVVFTPDDTDNYSQATTTVNVTINKAVPTGTPGWTALTSAGQTLSDVNLTTGTITPEGSIAWDLPADTAVSANTSYGWTFTPTDDSNYTNLTGTLVPYQLSDVPDEPDEPDEPDIPDIPDIPDEPDIPDFPDEPDEPDVPVTPPTTTETVTNPDGSTTTTVTRPDGSTTETTKNPDGSQQVVETDKVGNTTTTTTDQDGNKTEVVENTDGSSQITVENTDGSSSTTTVDSDGQTQAQVTLPQDVVEAAAEAGQAVALPIPEVPVTADRETAPIVTVELSGNTTAQVEIPVEDVTPGTVAVIVKADGTEEVIKTSLTTDSGVSVTLSDGDTVKIVDNSKDFDDVADSFWGAEAVAFAASRELFNGTSATTFEPDTDMSRAMIVTVLARLEGVDTSTGDTWYEAGAQWAMQAGVSDGSNLMSALTREQLVTMLYRYAGQPESGVLTGFHDAASVSGYAVDAMAWAVNNGIINGVGNNTLDPRGTATRAQVAAILMRFIQNLMK